jgi:transposase
MSAPRKYTNEVRKQARHLVTEPRGGDLDLSMNVVAERIGFRVWLSPDTPRRRVSQHRIKSGQAPGTMTGDATRIRALEREVKDLQRAREILLAASCCVARKHDPRPPW